MTYKEAKNLAHELNRRTTGWTQFRGCQAYVSSPDYKYLNLSMIRSYNTVVAIVDSFARKVYEIGKYSRTTSTQITKIMDSLYSGYERVLLEEE